MGLTNRCLEVRRDDLRTSRIVDEAVPKLNVGQALLRVDRFGLTSNNVTYGLTGDLLGYWGFFPASDGWGRIPVWGFAEVVDSRVAGVEPGTRVFGYLPMASHLLVEPVRVASHGFTDGAVHRANLPGVYNTYQRTEVDPLYSFDTEGLQAVFVPLFVTSFVLDDFLADNGDFGATQIVLSSASSKTAAGTALCLRRRHGDRPRIVGLTAPSHVAFAAGLGLYDQVVAYTDLDTLDANTPTVFVDVAGNQAVRAAIHRRLGENLRYSCTVGMAHGRVPPAAESLPGPKPTMFFAPSQIEKRWSDWGPTGYQQRLAAAWHALLRVVSDWVTVEEVRGDEQLQANWADLVDGTTSPNEAFIVNVDR